MSSATTEASLLRVYAVPPGPLGLTVKHYGSDDGALIMEISPSCPFGSGVCVGDRLVTINGDRIQSIKDLTKARDDGTREIGFVKRPQSSNAADYTKGQLLQLKSADAGLYYSLDFTGVSSKYGPEFSRRLSLSQRQNDRSAKLERIRNKYQTSAAEDEDDGEYKPGPFTRPSTTSTRKTRSGLVLVSNVSGDDWQEPSGKSHAEQWSDKFKELVEYNKRSGDFNPDTNTPLGKWLYSQRLSYKKGKVPEDRIERLDALDGFSWATPNEQQRARHWEGQLEKLGEFKEKHGHFDVPAHFPDLRGWVAAQRASRARGKLSRERIGRLDELGFAWETAPKKKSPWEEKFESLKRYKRAHGDCKVPQHYPPDGALGRWVKEQRKLYKKRELSEERISRLEAEGFLWSCIKRKGPTIVTLEMLQAAMLRRSG